MQTLSCRVARSCSTSIPRLESAGVGVVARAQITSVPSLSSQGLTALLPSSRSRIGHSFRVTSPSRRRVRVSASWKSGKPKVKAKAGKSKGAAAWQSAYSQASRKGKSGDQSRRRQRGRRGGRGASEGDNDGNGTLAYGRGAGAGAEAAGVGDVSSSASFAFYHAGLGGMPIAAELVSAPLSAKSGGAEEALQSPENLAIPAKGGLEDAEAAVAAVDSAAAASNALQLLSGACVLPHPDKAHRGGEDAFFILDGAAVGQCCPSLALITFSHPFTNPYCSSSCSFSPSAHPSHPLTLIPLSLPALSPFATHTPFRRAGVADGVGGWAEIGVDAGLYARELMAHVQRAVADEPKGGADPMRVLERAHSSTASYGSSTACVAVLQADQLQAANLGDSGFLIIRHGHAIFKSPSQQHDFNFPFQLGSEGGDSPLSADVYSLPVAPGDVVVMGTDGLFDNVFDNEVSSLVSHALLRGLSPQSTAEHLAALARDRALDRFRLSPFARAAQEAGYRYIGGKLDDITVVVSYVTEGK
ncbi:unnamed protein product [Closterium sp. NIES-65]|nr:unnamed protein product [Closterium sp. NIES-65]